MPLIKFQHSGKQAQADVGEWLYDVAERCQSGVPFSCKAGACGTCATEILGGDEHLAKRTARELRTLGELGVEPARHRLLCLHEAGEGDVVFGRPHAAPEERTRPVLREAHVEAYRPLNLTVAEVRFYVPDESFAFRPGQFMIFQIPDTTKLVRRSYSISTPPSDRGHFEVCVRAVAGGYGSNWIHRLRPGATVKVEGPYGKFVLDEAADREILMIATGTGMSPIKSMLLHLLDTGSHRRVRLFFGVRHESDLFYTDLLRGLGAHYPELESIITLSAPDPTRWAGPRGRVTDLIRQHVTAADAARTDVYLCGGREMITSCKELLVERGFPREALKHENFY